MTASRNEIPTYIPPLAVNLRDVTWYPSMTFKLSWLPARHTSSILICNSNSMFIYFKSSIVRSWKCTRTWRWARHWWSSTLSSWPAAGQASCTRTGTPVGTCSASSPHSGTIRSITANVRISNILLLHAHLLIIDSSAFQTQHVTWRISRDMNDILFIYLFQCKTWKQCNYINY